MRCFEVSLGFDDWCRRAAPPLANFETSQKGGDHVPHARWNVQTQGFQPVEGLLPETPDCFVQSHYFRSPLALQIVLLDVEGLVRVSGRLVPQQKDLSSLAYSPSLN